MSRRYFHACKHGNPMFIVASPMDIDAMIMNYGYATFRNYRVAGQPNWVDLGFRSEDERTDRVLVRERHARLHS